MSKSDIYKEIINLFIDLSEHEIIWPKECAIAKRLTNTYPEISFWRFIHKNTSLTLKLPSLAWFLTPKGKDCLSKYYKRFKVDFPPQKTYNIQEDFTFPIPDIKKRESILNLNF